MNSLEPDYLLHNRYRITRILGKGGMGTVYLANDLTLEKVAAVKENINRGDDSANQFLLEAHLLAALHHPNLPRVTDYFIEGSYQYLVMDYLPGDDLQSILEREGRQPLEKVLVWADQLADALIYMHSCKPPVIHRDIKPANIKLQEDGSAALVDFGIAKVAEASQKTSAGAMGFTPGFAPPEQTGGGHTGSFSDQYALAATIYTLLTGNRPTDSVRRALEGEQVKPARSLNPEIPENISDALHVALALNPSDRFSSVQEFKKALHDPAFRLNDRAGQSPALPDNKNRPVWFVPAMVLIGFLVLAIAGFSLAAMFKLVSSPAKMVIPVESNPVHETIPLETVQRSAVYNPPKTSTEIILSETLPAVNSSVVPRRIGGGKWLAYSSNQADEKNWQIWLMQIGLNSAGKPIPLTTRQLTFDEGDKTTPAWSPDGKYVLYSALGAGDQKQLGLDIWKIPVDGGQPVDITNREGDDLYPAWSPDGKWISFSNNGREDGVSQLYFMNPDGGDQERISLNYEEMQGIWTPNMQSLFYVINTNGHQYFYLRDAETAYKTPQPYDPNQAFGRLGQVFDPAFSPDGSLLAYTRIKGRFKQIGVASFAQRGASTSLVTTSGQDYDPCWSPDGRWIAFTSERDGIPQIYIMTAAGLLQTNVSHMSARETAPAWQP